MSNVEYLALHSKSRGEPKPNESNLVTTMSAIINTRHILLSVILVVSCVCNVSLWHIVPDQLSHLLLYLAGGCLVGFFLYQQRYGHLEEDKLIEVQLSRIAVLSMVLTLTLVAFSFLWEETQLRTLVVGAVGAVAMYVLLHERKPKVVSEKPIPGLRTSPEPPPRTDPLKESPSSELDWDEITNSLTTLGDRDRQMTLQMLRRIYAAATTTGSTEAENGESTLSESQRLKQVIWTVEQECQRLVQSAQQAQREHSDDDMLTKASDFLDWALQKTPEITQLDITDLVMGKIVTDINRLKVDTSCIVVDLSDLKAIHMVEDRETSREKTRVRALAARKSLAAIQSNGMVLSEALIASHANLKPFESITGIQVISLGPGQGYVTFEGNGRAWALKQAFSHDVGIKVEVRLFEFPTASIHEDIVQSVQRLRQWKKVSDEWPAPV